MRNRGLPRAVRIMLLHGVVGFLVAAVFVGGLLVLNSGGFGALLWRVGGPGAITLLWFFSGLTFGSALMGGAIMSLGTDAEGPAPGRGLPVLLRPRPLGVAPGHFGPTSGTSPGVESHRRLREIWSVQAMSRPDPAMGRRA